MTDGGAGRTHADRALRRKAGVESLLGQDGRFDLDVEAFAARHLLWDLRHPATINVRLGLIARAGNGTDPSPLQEIAASRSVAVQVLLLLLFEEHCRPPGVRRTRQPPARYLRDSPDPAVPAWSRLVATSTVDETGTRHAASMPVDNRVQQIKSALDRLAAAGRVELAGTGKGRYDRFRVLHEYADNRTSTPTPYTRPRAAEDTIDIPAGFFLNGWVHALNDNEIITYLLLRWRWKTATAQEREEGLVMSRRTWASAFGRGRGYESYRFLVRCGLVRADTDIRRRSDGTIRSHSDDDVETTTRTLPHRFFVLTGFDARAVPLVAQALQGIADGVEIEDAYAAATRQAPIGTITLPPPPWRRSASSSSSR